MAKEFLGFLRPLNLQASDRTNFFLIEQFFPSENCGTKVVCITFELSGGKDCTPTNNLYFVRINAGLAGLDSAQTFAAQLRKIMRIERNLAMSVVVPDEILTVTRMTEAEMCQEIAVMLLSTGKTYACSSQPICRDAPCRISTPTC